MTSCQILCGDSLTELRKLPAESVQCCVTSPPYFGLRNYNVDGQIGLESTPDQYVAKLVEIFREVRRVLRGDGVLFLNLGDSYAHDNPSGPQGKGGDRASRTFTANGAGGKEHGLKPKDLVGIPWSVAKALQQSYYTGRIAIERDRIWLAATIDAEGSICGFHHTRRDDGSLRTGIHLTITNTNRVMLDNAYRIWPTSRQDHNRHGEGHYGEMPCWRWIAHDVDEKAALLRELYPYFVCKQKQALLAWNFLELSKDAKRSAIPRKHRPQKRGDHGSFIR